MAFQNPDRDEIRDILIRSRRIAVVGLSTNPEKPSYMVSKAMQEEGYEIIPVNPNADQVLGVKAFPSLLEIDGHVDIVNVFRRNEFLPAVARQAAQIKADVFWAQLGLVSEEAYEICQANGITCIMDRCIKVEHALTVRGSRSIWG